MSLVPADELAKLVREEPAGARDRKEEAPGVDHPAPKTAPDENELRLREAAALRSQVANYEAALRAIDAEAAALEAGTHPEFVARAAPITAARDARIARSQRAHRAQLAALDKLRDAEVSVPYQATSLNTIVQMVANGIGVTLLPRMALEANLLASTDIIVRAFDDPGVERQIGLLWRRKSPRQAEFRLLGDFIAATQAR